jgi:hypothetical protein
MAGSDVILYFGISYWGYLTLNERDWLHNLPMKWEGTEEGLNEVLSFQSIMAEENQLTVWIRKGQIQVKLFK